MCPDAGLAKFDISPSIHNFGMPFSRRDFASLFNSVTEIILISLLSAIGSLIFLVYISATKKEDYFLKILNQVFTRKK